jgi:hypothetical protein
MRRTRWFVAVAAAVGLGLAGWAPGQVPQGKPDEPPPANKGREASPPLKDGEGRDPTKPTPELEKVLNGGKPGAPAAQMPLVQLKARVIGRGGKGTALLDIDGKVYEVHTGSQFSVRGTGGAAIPLNVLEVSAKGVRFEIGAAKEVQTLR